MRGAIEHGSLLHDHPLRQLWQRRELLMMLTWRDVRVRYKQSLMGMLWAVLMPAIIAGAGLLVRLGAARFGGGTLGSADVASVLVRAVVWAYFVGALRFGTNSLIANPSLVTKIAFPKEVFPIAAVLSNAFDLLVAAAVVVVALLCIGWRPGIFASLALPLLLLATVLVTGLSLVLSALNLFYRDVKYLVEVLLTYAIFVTPVLFPVSFAGPWQNLLLLNPLAPILEALSTTVVDNRAPDPSWLTYSCGVSLVVLVAGYALFKHLEAQFAERM